MPDQECSLNESRQTTGLDFVLDTQLFDNAAELYYCDEFSCITTVIDGFPSIVIINTVMYPGDFVETGIKKKSDFVSMLQNAIDEELFLSSDIYYLGVGLSQKDAPESERGVYKIGKRYMCHLSEIYLYERHVSQQYGYSHLHPVELSDVSDEYAYTERLRSVTGIIVDVYRQGSVSGTADHILDKWFVLVRRRRLIYRYALYLDPYAKSMFEKADWKAPAGFTID